MSDLAEEPPHEVIEQLVALIDSLREETGGFLDTPGDQQSWYNRGYANGILIALQRLGQAHRLGDRRADDANTIGDQFAMPWGKAYRHGESMGSRETHEITGTQVS